MQSWKLFYQKNYFIYDFIAISWNWFFLTWLFVYFKLDFYCLCSYGNTGCGVFKRRGTKLERFLLKNQHTQRKLLNFENWVNWEVSKIRHHFKSKVISKLMLSKNVNSKKCAPIVKWKKNEKDSKHFWHRKLNLKVKFWHFLVLFDTSHQPNSQN